MPETSEEQSMPRPIAHIAPISTLSSAGAESDAKPVVNGDLIKIRIQMSNEEGKLDLRVPKKKPMMKVMNVYCERMNLDINAVRFLFDNTRVQPGATPESLELENDSLIEVYPLCNGGRDGFHTL